MRGARSPWPVAAALACAITPLQAQDDFFDDDSIEAVPQVGRGELLFLAEPVPGAVPRSQNTITLTAASLDDGWVQVRQCHQGLDAVPDAEIVYRYRDMRGLRILSQRNIGQAQVRGNSVQLGDVRQDAALCTGAEVRILYLQDDGRLLLRNGPFHRRFLDGYFPMEVGLVVQYPPRHVRFAGISPAPQPGFAVQAGEGRVTVEARFAGSLTLELWFESLP